MMIKDIFLLFKRAPLWRSSVTLFCLSCAYCLYFPPHQLALYAPWLTILSQKPSQNSHNTLGDNAENSAGNADISYPNIDTIFHHHIILASHQIPLPAGQWHPILQAQTRDAFPIAFISLMRIENNNITGFIFAETTVKNAPIALTQNMLAPCHDDRNLILERHEQSDNADCIVLEPALLTGLEVNSDNFINDSIARIRLSGFVLPPFMIASSWRNMHLYNQELGNFIAIDTLLPPLEAHKHIMLAPFEAWQNGTIAHYPKAQEFLHALKSWLHLWQPMLEKAYINALPPSYPNKIDHDPLSQ